MSNKPYLSIVVASRNDDHDGSLLHRMRVFFAVLSSQLSVLKIPTEIIIVEWNPPKYRPPLKNILKLSKKNKFFSIKIITVPHKIHKLYEHNDRLNLFQFIAKNTGIRRAQGKFILSTNIDILFSNEIIRLLSRRSLKLNEMVRAIRFDVPDKIKENLETHKILKWCSENKLRGYYPAKTGIKNVKNILLRRLGIDKSRPVLFTNACGDFTLMSRIYWDKVQGYPEFPFHGVKIDGLLCYNAYFAGAKEQILSPEKCIYHIEHKNSWSGEKGDDLQERLVKLRIPFVTRKEYIRYIGLMAAKNRPYKFNNTDWGLAKFSFKEYVR